MAEKRMFAKSIVLSDAFLDMPMSARCLYFTLNMFADDDGFVGSPKGIMRQCGASQDDMIVLLNKRYVLEFDSGVIVIKHWRINNFLRKDRHIPTTYQEELAQLNIDEKGSYTDEKTIGQPMVNQWSTENSIDKNSIDKNSIVKRFHKPTRDEIRAYCTERGNHVSADKFYDYYESNGWVIGRNRPMKDWKAAVRTWEHNDKEHKGTKFADFNQRTYDYDALNERLGI